MLYESLDKDILRGYYDVGVKRYFAPTMIRSTDRSRHEPPVVYLYRREEALIIELFAEDRWFHNRIGVFRRRTGYKSEKEKKSSGYSRIGYAVDVCHGCASECSTDKQELFFDFYGQAAG